MGGAQDIVNPHLQIRPAMRALITVLVLLFALPFPLVFASITETYTASSVLAVILLELFCVLVLLGLWLPARAAFIAMRAGAALIGLALAASATHHVLEYLGSSTPGLSLSLRPILGFVIIGIPALLFAGLGRLPDRFSRAPADPAAPATEGAVLVHLDGVNLPDSVYEEHDTSTLEDQLAAILERDRLGACDGSETGPTETTVFMYGPDPERLFRAVEQVLREYPLCQGARVVIRRGGPGAPQRELTL